MAYSFARQLKVAAVCLVFAVAAVPGSFAKTLDIPTQHAHIDVPDSWSVIDKQYYVLYAVDSENGESMTVALFDNENGQGVESPQFVTNLSSVLHDRAKRDNASMKILNVGTAELGDVPADFLQAELAFPEGGVAYAHSYALAVNNSILMLTLLSRDPNRDASLQAIAKTLRFDQPPVLPGANLWTNLHLGRDLLVFFLFMVAALLVIAFARKRPKIKSS